MVDFSRRALTGLAFLRLGSGLELTSSLGWLAAGTWHLVLDGLGWHGTLWRSGVAGRRLGTGLASYPPDRACSMLRRYGWPTLVQDGLLLDGESFTPQADILLTHSSIGGLATVDVHHR